jgi:phosphatidylserine/phosphatidylglycerophosphate/cardiolipin synthase-like enzyme
LRKKLIKSNKIKRSAILTFALFSLWLAAFPDFSDLAVFEVVSSVPLATNISRAGTRDAALVWLEMIQGARHSLDFAEYYLVGKSGETLEPVVEAILAAARRGVRVRIMTETGMAENSKDLLESFRRQPGIEITLFNWKELTGGILHAKYFIVDENEVYIGSQNFDWRSLSHIHETGLHISSLLFARALKEIFETDWAFSRGDRAAYKRFNNIQPLRFSPGAFLVASPPQYKPRGVAGALDTLISLIDKACRRITVQLLDYGLEIRKRSEKFTRIDSALRRAARRGVQIKMLASDWNKRQPGVDDLKSLAKVKNIEIKFVTIPPFSGGFIPYARVIHSKVMRVDEDISWVGTSNWSYDYFFKSRNIEVVLQLPEVASALDEIFLSLWNGPYAQRLEPDKEYTAPRIK